MQGVGGRKPSSVGGPVRRASARRGSWVRNRLGAGGAGTRVERREAHRSGETAGRGDMWWHKIGAGEETVADVGAGP